MAETDVEASGPALAINTLERLLVGEERWRDAGDETMAKVYADATASLLKHLDLGDVASEAAARFVDRVADDRGLIDGGDVVLAGFARLSYVPQARTWTYEVELPGDWDLPLRVICNWLTGAADVQLGEDLDATSRRMADGVQALMEAAAPEEALKAVRVLVDLEMGVRGVR